MSVDLTAARRIASLGALALLLACGGDDPAPDSATVPAKGSNQPVAESAKAPPGAEAGRPAAAKSVFKGELRVNVFQGRVSLESNGARIQRVLRRLARRGIFELEIGQLEPKNITVVLKSVPMSQVLDHVLAGIPYSADYEVTRMGRTQLVWLSVGVFADPGEGGEETETAGADADSNTRETAREAKKAGRKALRRAILAARARRFEERGGWDGFRERQEAKRERRRELEEGLDSDDPDERSRAISALDPEVLTAKIAEAALSDSSVEVRVGAVHALGDADNFAGMQGLIDALNDPASEVVVAALEEIGDSGDESLQKYIEPLRSHPDPAISGLANEEWEWLEP